VNDYLRRRSSLAFLIVFSTIVPLRSSGEKPECSISGIVQSPEGSPLPGTELTLASRSGFETSITADAVGQFDLRGVPPGDYEIRAVNPGHLTVVQTLSLTGGESRELQVILSPDPGLRLQERVMVVGDLRTADSIPGSARYLDSTALNQQFVAFGDIGRQLQKVPGVYVQEEEGFGLRPNIGMRGTGTDRSSNITLMEDGILIAPAPYAAPAAYYFPVTARMSGIEVRKGSSQIKYGPRTHGGALNLISAPIPDRFETRGDVVLGSFGTRNLLVGAGDSGTHFGWLGQTYQIQSSGFKELDGGGPSGFTVHDYLFKFRLNTAAENRRYQQLQVKVGRTRQDADETYLGLSEEDFRETPSRRYAASQLDHFRSDFRQFQAQHFILLSERLDLTTSVYRHTFGRNWYKLGNVGTPGIGEILRDPEFHSTELSVLRGSDSDIDALGVRANNRHYYSQGVQTLLGLRSGVGRSAHQIEIGFRYHEDQEDRFQHDDFYQMLGGRMLLTRAGTPGSESNRVHDAAAYAFFVQDRLDWRRWTFVPGLRYERIRLDRSDYAKTDTTRTGPTTVRTNELQVVIPGLGVNCQLSSNVSFLGGVHRGFAPPGPGSTDQTEAESSINYEWGTRVDVKKLRSELVFFFNRYSNLLGRDTLSGGGQGTGDLFNGGRVNTRGFEASLEYDLREALPFHFALPVRMAYTASQAKFQNSFVSEFEPWGAVTKGDRLPYLPPHQLYLGVGFARSRWRIDWESSYVARMRTHAGQGPLAPFESTDSHIVQNLTTEYRLTEEGTRLFFTIENLTDSTYIAARHPAGLRPGLPRTFMAGIRFAVVR